MKENLNLFFLKYRLQIILILVGLIIIGSGFVLQEKVNLDKSKIEVLGNVSTTSADINKNIVIEIGGAVQNPGVYKLVLGSRVEDALIASNGFTGNADRVWVDKYLNRAAKLIDGQKIYIPFQQSESLSADNVDTQSSVAQSVSTSDSNLININTATAGDLDTLSGIGQTYAQKIIDQRPYSNINELTSKKIIPLSTFNKIKDKISVY